MTPRERIESAFKHRESDKIPVDLGATESSGITWIAYDKLKNHLGIHSKTKVFDLTQLIVKIEPAVTEAVASDAIPLLFEPKEWKNWEFQEGSVIEIPAGANLKKLENGDTVIVDNDGIEMSRMPKSGYYFDPVFHPIENATAITEIDMAEKYFKSYDLADYCDEGFKSLKSRAEKLYNETNYAIVGNLSLHLLAAGLQLRGFQNFMIDMVANKKFAHRVFENLIEAYLPRIDKYAEAVGNYIQVILITDDLGTQNGPQINPDLYREMIKPYHSRLWHYIKNKIKKPLLLHSCGSIYELIPDLIDAGIDALNPIQVSAVNMETSKLKKEFGKDIVFWGGGCDTQRVLPYGTPAEVREEVRCRVNDLAPGGGFVFCQVHNIQPDVPPENILAMFEELANY